MKLRNIILLALILIIGIGVYFVISGSYPVAFVGLKAIKARYFEKDYAAAVHYYQSAFKIYSEDIAELDSKESRLEIRRAVLDKLIENKLVRENLEKSIGAGKLGEMANKKIEESINKRTDIKKGVEFVYGLSFADFKRIILAPQAEREILEGRLFLSGGKIGEWLKRAKSEARVIILIPGFDWNGEGVIIE